MANSNEIIYKTNNGLELAGLEWGKENGPKILALHGWLDNAATYCNMAPVLASKFHVVAMDFAGHGKSAHRPSGVRYHLLDNVDDVIQFADALGWDEFYLMGHSMGAGVATYVSASFPERVKSLVLLEGVGTHSTVEDEAPQVLRKAVQDMERTPNIKMPVYPQLKDAIKARTSAVGVISEAASAILCERGTKKVADGVTWSSDPRLKMSSAMRLTEPLVQSFIKQIQSKVLFVGAQQGFGGNMPAIKQRLALISQLEQVYLPGNHHHHLEPDTCQAVAEAVLHFLLKAESTSF